MSLCYVSSGISKKKVTKGFNWILYHNWKIVYLLSLVDTNTFSIVLLGHNIFLNYWASNVISWSVKAWL